MTVDIYSKTVCSFCTNAKTLLNDRGISFVEHNIENDSTTFNEFKARFPTAKTVPQIVIDGVAIGGFTELVEYFKE